MTQDLAAVLHGYGAVVGHDRTSRVFPVRGVGGRVEPLEEFALQLALPLLDERCRAEDEYTPRESANHELLEDDSGLDRLAEPDLVGEDRAAGHGAAEHTRGDVDLVRELLDCVGVERDEAVEAWC
jgi:hypothetical protein